MKLEKWEHKGYHDLKITTERAQRKLHKCNRQAVAAASKSVTPLFGRLSAKLGIAVVRGLSIGLAFDKIEPPKPEATVGNVVEMDDDAAAQVDDLVHAVQPVVPEDCVMKAGLDSAAQTEALLHSLPGTLNLRLREVCSGSLKGVIRAFTLLPI